MRIKDLALNEPIDDVFILDSFNQRKTSKDSPFYSFKLRKRNETINAVDWNTVSKVDNDSVGKFVRVNGFVQAYQDSPQIVVRSMEVVKKQDVKDLSEIVPMSYLNIDDTLAKLESLAKSISDNDYQIITLTILNTYRDEYSSFPAGKHRHHAYIGGLLTHSYSIAAICQEISRIYGSLVNRSLLLSGAILHDIGKLFEYKTSELGLLSGRTLIGELHYHPILGADIIKHYGDTCLIPVEKVQLLQHMLLAHHGKPEYGAAVEPKIVEAEILHSIDELDFLVDVYRDALSTIDVGDVSGNIYSLGHPVYKHY